MNRIVNYHFELSVSTTRKLKQLKFYNKFRKKKTIFTLNNSVVYRSVNHIKIVRHRLNINPNISSIVQESEINFKFITNVVYF